MLSAEDKAALLLVPVMTNFVTFPRYDRNSVTTVAMILP